MKYQVALIFGIALVSRFAGAVTCENLTTLSTAEMKVTLAAVVSSSGSAAQLPPDIGTLPPFCRVAATLTPSPDSAIRIEVWMPISGWNGKYEGTGNGGFAGGIDLGALAAGLRRGYAVANTDMGTAPPSGGDADALIGHPEKWLDWGTRSTHEMTLAAKKIVAAFYASAPRHSYFVGCSTGGEQGLMEAQRFPDDYDGIVAGAPANNRTHLHIEILWDSVVSTRDAGSTIPPDKLSLITHAALKACPESKAVLSDDFFSYDPSACHWDPQSLVCKADGASQCLTQEQATTARDLYQGPIDPVTHQAIYPGVPLGSEFGWSALGPKDDQPPFASLFKWVFGSDWNFRAFDFSRDVSLMDTRLAQMLNATNPDLTAFKARGNKLIVYHGWADWLVPPQESINYYEQVANAQAKAARSHHRVKEEETNDFYRLFMIPGMSHCAGGPGLNTVNVIDSIESWVETGVAPAKIDAARVDNGATSMTRPVCPYPQTARYLGTGDTANASSFSCSNSNQSSARTDSLPR
jgi:feruloyl esterase